MARELTPEEAIKILRVRARTLQECADEVEMDRPDLAYKWRSIARSLLGD